MAGPTVFISYNLRDASYKDRFVTHLKVTGGEGWFEVWDDHMIRGGEDRVAQIRQAARKAKVVIMLVSAYFLVSEFMGHDMIPGLLERRRTKDLILFPVIVRTCRWQRIPWLSEIQVRPAGRPLAARRGDAIDAVLADVSDEIFQLVQQGAPAPEPIPNSRQLLKPWIGTPV